jgi:hypothetical protein
VEESYGEKMLKLTPMRAYIKKLLENPNVMRYLSAYHGEILTQFEVLAAADALLKIPPKLRRVPPLIFFSFFQKRLVQSMLALD